MIPSSERQRREWLSELEPECQRCKAHAAALERVLEALEIKARYSSALPEAYEEAADIVRREFGVEK